MVSSYFIFFFISFESNVVRQRIRMKSRCLIHFLPFVMRRIGRRRFNIAAHKEFIALPLIR